jgi:hypothetical protein
MEMHGKCVRDGESVRWSEGRARRIGSSQAGSICGLAPVNLMHSSNSRASGVGQYSRPHPQPLGYPPRSTPPLGGLCSRASPHIRKAEHIRPDSGE